MLSEFLLLRLRVTFDTLHLFMHVISTLVCVEIYPYFPSIIDLCLIIKSKKRQGPTLGVRLVELTVLRL